MNVNVTNDTSHVSISMFHVNLMHFVEECHHEQTITYMIKFYYMFLQKEKQGIFHKLYD